MKYDNPRKRTIILILLLITTSILPLITIYKSNLNESNVNRTTFLAKISYYNNSASPIYINGSKTGPGAHNWSWAATQPWCSGSGTESDPYLIENLKINGNNASSCIEIENSDTHFVVRNCTLYNSSMGAGSDLGGGIKLKNVSNGTIYNNNCSYNGYYGILLNISCNNNIIKNNIIHDNTEGIVLAVWSCYNSIVENIVYDNQVQGIIIAWVSNFNNITDNILTNNGICGIGGIFSSYFNLFENNIVSKSQWGIALAWGTSNCTVINNQIYENSQYGIYLDVGGGNHSIMDNSIVNNTLCGLNITQGEGNSIYFNSFVNPGYNAYDDGVSNVWDNGSHGNYWDDYTGGDAGDGTGAISHWLAGSALSQDNHPIMNSIPSVDLSVNTSKIIEQQTVQFNCDYTGGNGHLSFSWNFGDGFSSSEQNPVHQYLISGNHTVTLRIMDVNRDACFENTYLFVEIDTKPNPDFYLNESKVEVGKIVQFTYNGTEGNDPLYLEWDFGDNTTSTGMVSEHEFNKAGRYEIKLIVTDGNGDWANKTMILRVIDGSVRNEPPSTVIITIITALVIVIGISIIGVGIILTKKRNNSISDSITPSKSSTTSSLVNNLPHSNDQIHKPKKSLVASNQLQANHFEDIETKRKEIEETESQMGIVKPKIMCVVHKGPIIGPSYICPRCETFYCMNCARVLKMRGESCWSCKLNINL